jgi:YHS domain-containing protein
MSNANILVAMPILLALVLLIGFSVTNRKNISVSTSLLKSIPIMTTSESDTTINTDTTCGTCPTQVKAAKCTDSGTAVLGGLDVVNYFAAYRVSTGVYNDTLLGVAGSSKYESIFNGYTFRFSTSLNKKLFDMQPTKYIPQYGGFCTWGMSTETCPSFPWSVDCMGPYGNWHHWTIYEEKLYLFWFDSAKTNFKTGDMKAYVAAADARWANWYGDDYQSVYSTNCFVSVDVGEPTMHR